MSEIAGKFIKKSTDTEYIIGFPENQYVDGWLYDTEPFARRYEINFACNGINYTLQLEYADPVASYFGDLNLTTREQVIEKLIEQKDSPIGRKYLDSIAELNNQLTVTYVPTFIKSMTAFASSTSVTGNRIFINPDGYDNPKTVFHEWAHLIDYNVETYSSSTNLIGEIEADVRNSIKTKVIDYYLASGQTYNLSDIDLIVDFFMDPYNNEACLDDRGFTELEKATIRAEEISKELAIPGYYSHLCYLNGTLLTESQADCVTYIQNSYNSLSGISRDIYGGVTNNFIVVDMACGVFRYGIIIFGMVSPIENILSAGKRWLSWNSLHMQWQHI